MENDLSDIQLKTLKTIIEWAKHAKTSKRIEYADNGTTFSIPLKAFNMIADYRAHIFMKDFFDDLKNQDCFENWSSNPYKRAGFEEFVFNKVNFGKLQQIFNSSVNQNVSQPLLSDYDYPDKSKWTTKNNSGTYIFDEEKSATFRASYFGAIDLLIRHSPQGVKSDKLKESIAKHSQGNKTATEISIASWHNDLKKRKEFRDKFLLQYTAPDNYLLYIKR